MTGLFLLALVWLWAWLMFKLSRWIGGRVTRGRWRWPLAVLLFTVLLPLPVVDELIARPQIEKLCRERAVLKIDEQKIKGRRVKSFADPLNERVPGTAIPVTFTKFIFRDAETSEELASRGSYDVKGGALVRGLGLTQSPSPLFVRDYCAPSEGIYEAAKRIGFTIDSQLRK